MRVVKIVLGWIALTVLVSWALWPRSLDVPIGTSDALDVWERTTHFEDEGRSITIIEDMITGEVSSHISQIQVPILRHSTDDRIRLDTSTAVVDLKLPAPYPFEFRSYQGPNGFIEIFRIEMAQSWARTDSGEPCQLLLSSGSYGQLGWSYIAPDMPDGLYVGALEVRDGRLLPCPLDSTPLP